MSLAALQIEEGLGLSIWGPGRAVDGVFLAWLGGSRKAGISWTCVTDDQPFQLLIWCYRQQDRALDSPPVRSPPPQSSILRIKETLMA